MRNFLYFSDKNPNKKENDYLDISNDVFYDLLKNNKDFYFDKIEEIMSDFYQSYHDLLMVKYTKYTSIVEPIYEVKLKEYEKMYKLMNTEEYKKGELEIKSKKSIKSVLKGNKMDMEITKK